MVFVNNIKYACESCIKGHRSSSCHHNDRPLFEIKKKGRPVSQCEKCRELRQTRRVHSKCLCDDRKSEDIASPRPKSRRFVPIAPALPNGLKGALKIPESLAPADPRQKVESLLNPCSCQTVWNCTCRPFNDSALSSPTAENSLATLANVALMSTNTLPDVANSNPTHNLDGDIRKRDLSRSESPDADYLKKRRTEELEYEAAVVRGPDLPPLRLTYQSQDGSLPAFPTAMSIPSLKSVASLAGTGCTCGFNCACPGCIEHRGPSARILLANMSQEPIHYMKDCADGCGHCVDNLGGIELPNVASTSSNTLSSPSQTVMEEFLARAATLPVPPRNRPTNVDPTNITVFPIDLFSQTYHGRTPATQTNMISKEQAWGIVSIPKLDCCDGFCGCPEENCRCGSSCGGCCAADDEGSEGQQIAVFTETSRSVEDGEEGGCGCEKQICS